MAELNGESVCVTGAGGFIASWVVKLLLERGYTVRGTVRELGDGKNEHLEKLEGAKERLTLLKADLLDYDSLLVAINGCSGVFNIACPVPSERVADLEVEVCKGSLNVLKACSVVNVKRVVMTSSFAAVCLDPKWPLDKILDESCWTDIRYCKESQNWYYMSKTVSEQEAWKYSKESDLDLVTICPSLVLGPMLQPRINASSFALVKLFNGESETCGNKVLNIVDVRDVAKAHLLAYENPTAAGRHICATFPIRTNELVDILKALYPQYTYPKHYVDTALRLSGSGQVSTSKLQELGLEYMPLEQTLVDTVECLQKRNILK